MADHTPITNRRQLLIGTSALALTGALAGAAPVKALLPAPSPNFSALDPAQLAYNRAVQLEKEMRVCQGWRGKPGKKFYALYRKFIDAELALADTEAASLSGIKVKVMRIGADMLWREGDHCMASRLGFSVMADLDRMIADMPDFGRLS